MNRHTLQLALCGDNYYTIIHDIYFAAQLSECVGAEGKVIAVDPDGERLKTAQEKYARDNIEYVSGNDATFPEGPYDLVFASQVIQWWLTKMHSLGACIRV